MRAGPNGLADIGCLPIPIGAILVTRLSMCSNGWRPRAGLGRCTPRAV